MDKKAMADLVGAINLRNGNLAEFNPEQRLAYYNYQCDKYSLDAAAQPFQFLSEKGKVSLYLTRGGAEQLSVKNSVSLTITSREIISECYVVTARASYRDEKQVDRQTESLGAVGIDNLKGDARANAMMKAETKAKRRATISLLGLGMLDELEVESFASPAGIEAGRQMTPGNGQPAASAPQQQPQQQQGGQPSQTEQPGQQQAQNAELPFFKRQYQNKDEILNALEICKSPGEVGALYHANAKLVDGFGQALKDVFSAKRDSVLPAEHKPNF